jgi:hypothetical protein
MKRTLLCLSALLLLSSMAVASSRPDWGAKRKPRYATPEPGIVSMLLLSLGTISGGLVLRHRRDK